MRVLVITIKQKIRFDTIDGYNWLGQLLLAKEGQIFLALRIRQANNPTCSRYLRFIEVKGRVKAAPTITVIKNEIIAGFNQPEKYILAIVLIDGDEIEGPIPPII